VEVSLDKQWIAYNRLIINTETQEIRSFSGQEGMFSPDGKFYGAILYTVEPNDPVSVIRLDDGKQIVSCKGIPLSFSHNSEVAFACGRLWDLSTGRTRWSFNQTLSNVRFSKDDSRLLGIRYDYNNSHNALFFLDTKNGKVLAQSKMPAGTGFPEGLILDPQGLILLAGDDPYYHDRSIYAWNAKDNQIFPIFRPANVISKMELIANGHILVAQDRDGVIHFLGIDEQKAANLEQSYAIATAVATATPAPLYGPKSGEIDEKRWQESSN
jgi:WD40 repeat protein